MAAKPAASNTAKLTDQAAYYGFLLSVLQANPELAKIFSQASAPGPGGTWSRERFMAAVESSQWWKTQSADTRQWVILQETDPKTAAAKQAQRVLTVKQAAAQAGIGLSAATITQVANDSLRLGWDDAQVQQSIGAHWVYNPSTTQAGIAAKTVDQIKATAAAYAVPISTQSIQQYAHGVLTGMGTADDYTEAAKAQAKSLYGPDVSRAIDAGQTVEQYADPYKQLAIQNLGVNPDDVNWTQPKWSRFLNTVDPKSGQRQGPLSLADAVKVMRTDPQYGYDTSEQGRQSSSQLTTALAQKFGAM